MGRKKRIVTSSSVEASDSSETEESSSDDDGLKPPTLKPELPALDPLPSHKKNYVHREKSRKKEKHTKATSTNEIACQTIESGINTFPSTSHTIHPIGNT